MSDDAISVSASVEGAGAVGEYFAAAGETIRDRVRRALVDSGKLVQARAQASAAFRDVTGNLRASIQPRLTESDRALTMTVKPSDHVGLFLEGGVVAYGTTSNARTLVGRRIGKAEKKRRVSLRQSLAASGGWRIEPRHFMRDAFASVRDQIADNLEAALEQGIADAGGE